MRLFLILLTFWMVSCGQKQEPKPSAAQTEKPVEQTQSKLVVSEVEDREPQIEMVNVEFMSGKAQHSAWIQDRDAKYYLVDGGYGSDLNVEVEGGHPGIQVIVINPQEEMIFRQNLNGEKLEWNGHYDQSGRFTFIIQLDSKLDNKRELRTQFNATFEKAGL